MSYTDGPVYGTDTNDNLVYARLLLQCGKGYPLWNPQPAESPNVATPEGAESEEVQIGDVGVLSNDGAFTVFFNIVENGAVTNDRRNIPADLERVTISDCPSFTDSRLPGAIFKPEMHPPPQLERSVDRPVNRSEVETSITLRVSFPGGVEKSAALSIFPDSFSPPHSSSALQQKCTEVDVTALRTQAQRHYKDWMQFVRGYNGYSDTDSLFLVTGFTKARSWATALMWKKNAHECKATFAKNYRHNDQMSILTVPGHPTDNFRRRRVTHISTDRKLALFVQGLLITRRLARDDSVLNTDIAVDQLRLGKELNNGGSFLRSRPSIGNQASGAGNRGGRRLFSKWRNTPASPESPAEFAIIEDSSLDDLLGGDPSRANYLATCREDEFMRAISSHYRVIVADGKASTNTPNYLLLMSSRIDEGCGYLERKSNGSEDLDCRNFALQDTAVLEDWIPISSPSGVV
ncbi:hypothetical protein AAF712_012673 [Marasmius tenuissimus]|uniref:Uncharacterized protein n=1 Tax=Marasmius tenuissimus TaxID=585030 RepID=A0ABR2ZGW2_9AGAR